MGATIENMAVESNYYGSIFVRDRLAITVTVSLVVIAAVCWIASYYLMPFMMMSSNSAGMGMTNGVAAIVGSTFSLSSVLFFDLLWVIGMAAMMFPAMIPVMLFYNKVAVNAEEHPKVARILGTPVFLIGYLAMYAVLGIGAYIAIFFALMASSTFSWLAVVAIAAPSAVLIVTGIYQFSSLKNRCLSHCISPIGFFAVHSKRGISGAAQMGFHHGVFCVGCCWAFMLVMLGVAAMSLPAMAILSGVIAVEKIVARGSVWYNRAIGAGFIVFGVAIWFIPGLLSMI
jgi:predicted metal-binding membrane protein